MQSMPAVIRRVGDMQTNVHRNLRSETMVTAEANVTAGLECMDPGKYRDDVYEATVVSHGAACCYPECLSAEAQMCLSGRGRISVESCMV
ncbi:hypothetical protein SKAU_G00364380 [Synaphobranchus kaupii]|uniref:Uncharacterized protein n=1 Tax=Synaphobranchus kaupii TaxID=118154 RepID=A0A9Q1IF62_SYNKA|nr:hypothetical protein SKAU_G00364380 [Synaphobranchus kaupii]